MRSLLITTVALAALACVYAETEFEKATVQELLDSADSINQCLINKAPCSPLAKSVDDIIAKVFPKECSDCTAEEKLKMGKLFNNIRENHPEDFKNYIAIFDPKGEKDDLVNRFLAENQ